MAGGERAFFEQEARDSVTGVIKEIEAQTSAEIVVAVRNASGSYRDVDYLFGFVISLAALGVLLFHPYEFATEGMPLDVALAFVLGALLCANVRPIRRAFIPRRRRNAAALLAARAGFVERGVGRTSARNGIFVLISLFERRVDLVADVGIEPTKLGPEWSTRVSALERSLEGGAQIDRFLEALRALAPVLGAAMPHQDDDLNELPDEVGE